jgi:hypothetical protein
VAHTADHILVAGVDDEQAAWEVTIVFEGREECLSVMCEDDIRVASGELVEEFSGRVNLLRAPSRKVAVRAPLRTMARAFGT